jgi:signal peptidase I
MTAEERSLADSGPDEPSSAGEDSADGAQDARPAGRKAARRLSREVPIGILLALIIAVVIKTFVVQAFVIPSGSMENTLRINDKILVNKLVYHFRSIKPGDVVVFDGTGTWVPPPTQTSSANPIARAYDDTLRKVFDAVGGLFGSPVGQTDFVKRVIGVPGDHVVCCNAQGLVTVNGVALHEKSYLYPGNSPGSSPGAGIPGRFNVKVPAGYIWVLGDHRAVSNDSRGHQLDPGDGMIPEGKVIGRAFLIVWPPSHWRVLSIPSTFDQPGIDSPARAAAMARGHVDGQLISSRVEPEPPYLPVVAGFACAVPLTWLQRRARRLRARRRAGRG